MTTTKKTAARRAKVLPADMATDLAIGLFTEKKRAEDRSRLLAWLARIMGEIDAVGQSIRTGSFAKWDGILDAAEQHELGTALDHVWSRLADAMPKAAPAELVGVLADARRRDR